MDLKIKKFIKDICKYNKSGMFSALLFITFIISLYFKNIICIYVFGCIYIIKSFYSTFEAFIKRDSLKQGKKFLDYSIIIEFCFSIFVSVSCIYFINNYEVKNILIPVISAVYGGFITLLGVGWTIKQSENEKIQEEIRRNKPLLFLVDSKNSSYNKNLAIRKSLDTLIYDGDNFNSRKNYKVEYFMLENGDYSYSSIVGFMINDDFLRLSIGQTFAKNIQYIIYTNNIEFRYKNKIDRVYLVLKDMIDKIYLADMNFKIEEADNENKIIFESIISIKLTDKIKLDKDQQFIVNHQC